MTAKPTLRVATEGFTKKSNVQQPDKIGTKIEETTNSPTTNIVKSNIFSL